MSDRGIDLLEGAWEKGTKLWGALGGMMLSESCCGTSILISAVTCTSAPHQQVAIGVIKI